jgi:uncharacterized LabA/DUF88 family protein
MISQTNQRVAILIDTANLYHTAKYVYRSKVHFESLAQSISKGRTITRVIAYTITSDSETETAFLDTLSSAGIEVRTKPLITYRSGTQKADWDVGITVDAIALAQHVDTIIIVSGDGDFAPLMRHLRSLGVRAEAAAFDQSVSQSLLDVVDDFHDLSTMTDIILINQKNPLQKRTETSSRPISSPTTQSVTDTRDTSTPAHEPNPSSAQPVVLVQTNKVNRQNGVRKNIISDSNQPEQPPAARKVARRTNHRGTHETNRQS